MPPARASRCVRGRLGPPHHQSRAHDREINRPVDAGPLYAAAARRDNNHGRCVTLKGTGELLTNASRPLLVGELVVTEVAYLLNDRIGPHAELAFSRAISSGELTVEPVADSDWSRITELTEQYADLPLGIVDSSVIALAERRGLAEIATLDRRHFSVVAPGHTESFTLLP